MKFTQKMMAVFAVAAVLLAEGVPACAVPGSPANTTVNAKKVLVVYYSATGTTERLAKIIAQETKADTFVIRPKQPYTSADLNWNNKNSRVVQEHEMGVDKVSVTLESTTVPNFESYDTVFIGYPIWWREVTFCTSISTGTGESRKRLEKLAKTGNWVTGERFPSSFSEVSVKAWLKGLGF